MNIFWTSDWHLNHFNIIRYTGRPFKTLEEMNSTIINNFNSRVKEDDLVFFLGDFCFKSGTGRGEGEPDKAKKWKDLLNCKNIVWVGGNHDKNNSLRTPIQNVGIVYGGKRINMVHNPEFCNINYEINIVGHVHEKWKIKRYKRGEQFTDCINVSIEQWGYNPVTWNELWQSYSMWLKEQKRE